MGHIKDWKEVGCAAGSMRVVHRSDGSGTTAAFTESLQSFSKEWSIGAGKSVNWKVGIGGKGKGVAGAVTPAGGKVGAAKRVKGEDVK